VPRVTSREKTAALKAAVDNLMRKFNDYITISAPPWLDTIASSTSMEEMMMQLYIIQNDIQDILEAVHNPPGKRKQCTSNQDSKPIMPTLKNRQLATQKPWDTSPEYSPIYSCYATTATQEVLDSLIIKYPPCQLTTAITSATPTPPPDGITPYNVG
jgi:hypothetical protein